MTVTPPDWAVNTPAHPPIHNEPARNFQWEQMSQDQIRILRQRLLEAIVQIVVQSVTGLFVPTGQIGAAVEQLEDWANALLGSFNDILGDLDNWIYDLIFGTAITEPEATFPLTFPYTFGGGEPTQTDLFFYWVRKFTTLDEIDDLFDLNLVDLVVNFIETLLKPQQLLAELIDGILPDSQAPNIVYEIMDAIVQAFAGIPVVGPLVQGVWDTINGLLGIGNDAQSTGTDNSAEIAQIKAAMAAANSGGVSFIDGFDRIVATTLGSDWTQIYSGAGAGYEGLDGTGYAHWSAAGGVQHVVLNLCNTPLTTNTQYSAFVLRDPPYQWFSLQPVSRSLVLRSNAAGTNRVQFNIFPGGVANFQIIVGNSVVHTTNATGLPAFKNGDLWEFFAGSTAEDYQFAAKINGKTVLNYIDSGHVSQMGPSNLYTGFGGVAGIHVILIIAFQDSPPDVAAFSTADRLG